MDTSILIFSCDNFSDTWEPFFTLKDKYWADCPYKTYIVTETKRCSQAKTLKATGSWTQRIKKALTKIDTEYVITMCDDFFIRSKVDQARIEYCISKFDDKTAVFNFEKAYNSTIKCDVDGFGLRENNQVYLCSCQPSIWNRTKLIELLDKDMTAWEWELQVLNSQYKHYINTGETIIDIGYNRAPFSITQGKWCIEIVPFFDKEGIKIDYSQRGFRDLKLSIIIPYYKTLELTKKLLDKLIPQLTHEIEVILIDDGCNELELDKYPIKVIHKPNGGVSSARNIGLDNAQAKYIAFIDSDDMILDNYISTILNKINTVEFDYCFISWKYLNGRDMIIKDNPPVGNNAVWNCIYRRDKIDTIRFPEHLQIGEEIEFNKKTRTGKKENILDVLYEYNSSRIDSLSTQYRKGLTGVNVTDKIETQFVIYRSYLSKIGGIETAIYNACYNLKDLYDVVVVYDTCDPEQLVRLRKIVKCVKYDGQNFKCDTFMYYGVNPQKIEKTIDAKQYIQQICNDMSAVVVNYNISPKTNKIFADSKASAEAFTKKHRLSCGVLHNLFAEPQPKRVLNLMSATRLSPEKGYDRMKTLAKKMIEKGIPFEWTVFTNDVPNEEIDGFIFRKPRLNVVDYMHNKDYGIQLSNIESWGCAVTEFLSRGVPVICTDYPSATEQVEHGKNGFILNRNLSNLDEIVELIYSSYLKGFEYIPKHNIEEWTNILGDSQKKDYYTYEDELYNEQKHEIKIHDTICKNAKLDTNGNVIVKIRALKAYVDVHENRLIAKREEYEVTSDRAKEIIKKEFAEIVI